MDENNNKISGGVGALKICDSSESLPIINYSICDSCGKDKIDQANESVSAHKRYSRRELYEIKIDQADNPYAADQIRLFCNQHFPNIPGITIISNSLLLDDKTVAYNEQYSSRPSSKEESRDGTR